MHKTDHGHAPSSNQGYEPSDIQLKIVVWSGVAVVIMTFVAYVVSTFVVHYVNAQPPISDVTPTPMAVEQRSLPFAPGVRLQVSVESALKEVRAAQHEEATTYGVVSAEPEIFRIPVETAMDIVAERGLPAFPVLTAPEAATASTEQN